MSLKAEKTLFSIKVVSLKLKNYGELRRTPVGRADAGMICVTMFCALGKGSQLAVLYLQSSVKSL